MATPRGAERINESESAPSGGGIAEVRIHDEKQGT
jgi:hypothetical protein